ncbi:MAG: AAA family ATPase, partial [Blautia sp.]|nr:AAA family ATPase [Blautia sp.]
IEDLILIKYLQTFFHRLKYDLPGIVLIDEIELHLHISWQKRVLPFLTKAFPNVQFIIATHSPFVVSSIESAVVYDLEKNIRIENLSEYSYDCLVNSLFDTSMYSNIMSDKYRKYVELIKKEDSRNESENEELVDLIKYFEAIPAFMAKDIILDFKKMERERQNG